MQYHQDNERQGRYNPNVATSPAANNVPLHSMYPEPRRFRLVPAAVICAFVVVGGLIYYNYRQTPTQNNNVTVVNDEATESRPTFMTSPVSETSNNGLETPDEVTISGSHRDLTSATNTDNTTSGGAIGTVNAAGNNETITLPADTTIKITSGNQTYTVPASSLTTSKDGSNTINITINPVVEAPKTTQATQVVKQVTVPVQTVNYVPADGYYYANYNYNTTSWNNKPYTPYIENCGNFDGGHRWNDARIVLPKYERDGKAAVEYEVNVGTSVGNSDVWSHRYEQTDRVVFSLGIDDEREYFVRFRVRMDGGNFGDWSDTFRFKCHRV